MVVLYCTVSYLKFQPVIATYLLASQVEYWASGSFSLVVITCTGGALTSTTFAILVVSCRGSSVTGNSIWLMVTSDLGVAVLEMTMSTGLNSPFT